MPGFTGRKVIFRWGADDSPLAALAGVRTKNLSINNEPVDVTNDDSDGWRTLLTEAGEKTVNLSLSGIVIDGGLKEEAMADSDASPQADLVRHVTLTYPDGGVIEGDFFLASYTETGEYNGAATFDCELQSTGAVSFTPGS